MTSASDLFARWRKPMRKWLQSQHRPLPDGCFDDICQETFLRLLRYSDVELIANPQTYLFRIAGNVANEMQEKALHRKVHLAIDWTYDDRSDENDGFMMDLGLISDVDPQLSADLETRRRYIVSCLENLPARQRKLLLEHVEEGMTYKQIAEREGLSYRIVLRDLTRAYASLRAQFAKDGQL